MDFNLAALNLSQHPSASLKVHRLSQAIPHGLEHQRMVRQFDVGGAGVVLAGYLGREGGGQEVVGAHTQ